MDFELSDEHLIIKETIRNFVQKECPRELARELEEKEEVPSILWDKLSELGFFGLTVPEKYGGEGVNSLGGLITIEELSGIFPSLALFYTGTVFCGGGVISCLGDENQKEAYLEKLARGKLIFTTALAEEEVGLNLENIKAAAETKGNELIVSGEKKLVALGEHADYYIVLVKSQNQQEGSDSLSILLVDAASPGITKCNKKKIGMKSAGSYELLFNQVRVPAANVLGGSDYLNRGKEQISLILDLQNLAHAASRLGIARGVFEYARNHARNRVQFGLPIIEFNAVKKMLVELVVEIEACRLFIYRAGNLADTGKPFSLESSMALSSALRLAKKAAGHGIQICGGYGYALEYDAQRYWRDTFAAPINGQTTETIDHKIAVLEGL